MSIETITFALAMMGFFALTIQMSGFVPVRHQRFFLGMCGVIILTHVLMVWWFRYEWQFAQATRNGYTGFLIFHTALACIITAPFLSPRYARNLITVAFLIVCAGANGAVVRYEVVAVYQFPVILCTILGLIQLARGYRARRIEA